LIWELVKIATKKKSNRVEVKWTIRELTAVIPTWKDIVIPRSPDLRIIPHPRFIHVSFQLLKHTGYKVSASSD